MTKKGISLLELQESIAAKLKADEFKDVWVRCEITECNDKGRHIYLDLTESSDGNIIAKQKASIWQSNKSFITEKFQKGTGTKLQKGLQVLLCVSVDYKPAFGLNLVVKDIDPSFTEGQLQVKIKEIKNALVKMGMFGLNKDKPLPQYFERIAVLTPAGSAGEGDFKQGADLLESHGLCEFEYFAATMQGLQAESSMSQQLKKINLQHKETPYDALIIIRGGGAVADLSWLNNFTSAKYICNSYMPVITGLGHERDICVLDEISKINAGTPSKCIEYITKNNLDQIYKAQKKIDSIKALKHQAILTNTHATHTRKQRISQEYGNAVARATLSKLQARSNAQSVLKQQIKYHLSQTENAKRVARVRFWELTQYAHTRITERRATIENTFNSHRTRHIDSLSKVKMHMDNFMITFPAKLLRSYLKASQAVARAFHIKIHNARNNYAERTVYTKDTFSNALARIAGQTLSFHTKLPNTAVLKISQISEQLVATKREIYLFNPMKILSKGYVIARSTDGKPITTAKEAQNKNSILLDFQDSTIPVTPNGDASNEQRPKYLS
ncbi:exodeoxyribonuclease VII large subunit [Alteromonas macleodii]|uniref:exodeoxyribonuclease VII large subunit n=1 Tax=Alteromonas macleodii TaxID=28108 RepID=UPI0031401BB7|tara:strand:- start:204485 stop:206155 length:1671 start_codon:yes stop_codon:yes gene_type:complete